MVAIEQVVARSANVVVFLPVIRAFRAGCLLEVEVICRQDSLSPDEWWDLSMSAHGLRPFGGGRLPDRMLRMGVRFSDGAKATTVEQRHHAASPSAEPPPGPLLAWWPGGGGVRGGGEFGFGRSELWLWPLPPAEPFQFAVEWPLAGIELTIVELDGATITAAAERSTDSGQNRPLAA